MLTCEMCGSGFNKQYVHKDNDEVPNYCKKCMKVFKTLGGIEVKKRECLSCEKEFNSISSNNRRCNQCRGLSEYISGMDGLSVHENWAQQ